MENIQKALVMAGSVFMFVIAMSVAVFSYTRVTDVIDKILSVSDYNARTAEYFIEDTLDTTRYATKAEVIMTVMSMKSNDFSADTIVVDGTTFNKIDFSTVSGTNTIEKKIKGITSQNYTIQYEFNSTDPNNIKKIIKFRTIAL